VGRPPWSPAGSRGIGRAIVERLARDGARVLFGYRRDDEAAAAVVEARGPCRRHLDAGRTMRDDGRIVNISTLNTVVPGPGGALYTASKAAREFGPRRTTVDTVSPGAVDTELLRSTNPAAAPEWTASVTALRRLGQPADIADVVAFPAGPDSRWITGQNLRATGGFIV
jgi:3-oxoacyl-[acyl-carrier protein] reductase